MRRDGTALGNSNHLRVGFAWAVCALTCVVTAAGIALLLLTPQAGVLSSILYVLEAPVIAVFGAVIVAQHADNRVGWLMLLGSLPLALSTFTQAYATFAYPIGIDTVTGGVAATWLGEWIWLVAQLVLALLLQIFPTGRALSRRWRWVIVGSVVDYMVLSLFLMFTTPMLVTTPQGENALIPNPIGVIQVGDLNNLFPFLLPFILAPTLLATIALVLRFVRARGVERQQLKWFLYATGIFVVTLVLSFVIDNPILGILNNVLAFGLPAALGISILRYRLYDIDILIRRTVSYAIVAAMLAVVYFGCVIVLQQVFATISGQRSELITVLSTLAIAALFIPLRNRIQNGIDKRFNRNRYDAQQVLQQFATGVRDETDLEKLSGRLMEVVDETMQPKSVSIWLKR